MTSNYYIFRILYLKCNTVIRLKENIYILPSEVQEIRASIYFDLDSFSYLLIKTKTEENEENLRQTVELIISFFSLLLENQFYTKEYYHFYSENKLLLKKAHLYPIPEPFVKKHQSFPPTARVKIVQFIFKKWYEEILDNRVKDSLFHIIAELNAGLRNTIFEISAGLLWNAWEHLASSYWKIDKDKLYIITKTKFKEFIKLLKKVSNCFIKQLKPGDILLENILNGRYNYKTLLKRNLSKDMANYSPANYRIYQMFDMEGETLTNQEIDFITVMNKIRNDLYHKGLSLKEIGEKENIKPVEFLEKFKSFTCRKFLEFFGIINKFANYAGGIFQWKDEVIMESDKEEFLNLNEEMTELHSYIKRLNKVYGISIEAELRWNNQTHKIRVKFIYDLFKKNHYLIMSHLPIDYKRKLYRNIVIQTNINYQPEDLIKLIHPIEVIIDLGVFRATIIIRINKPTETNFDLANIILNRNDLNEFAKFQIGDIIFEKK